MDQGKNISFHYELLPGARPTLGPCPAHLIADARDDEDKDTISGRHSKAATSRAATISPSDAQRILNANDGSKVVR